MLRSRAACGRTPEQKGTFASVLRERRGTGKLSARFRKASKFLQQVSPHARQQVVTVESRFRDQRIDELESGCRAECHGYSHRAIEIDDW